MKNAGALSGTGVIERTERYFFLALVFLRAALRFGAAFRAPPRFAVLRLRAGAFRFAGAFFFAVDFLAAMTGASSDATFVAVAVAALAPRV